MKFCKKCSGALNFFETNEDEVCWSCVRKEEKTAKPASAEPESNSGELTDLSGCSFSLEGDMLVLKSPEGWLLWSGPADKEVKLGDIVKRARRIHQIRSKRRPTKN